MEKELHNHPFSLSLSKALRAWFDRPVLGEVEGLTMSGTTTFTACVTYARLNSRKMSHNAAIIDRDGSWESLSFRAE